MAKWPTKLWQPNRFAALARRIREELGCEVVFTGSNSDRPVIRRIMGMMPSAPVSLAGQTSLKELAYLYTRCKLLVTTDTGPMHVAAAMGCPVVALFGPTAPWRTGPYGKGHAVIRADVGCSPCFKKKCDHMTCMKEIGVEQVFKGVQEVMS
jgi:3-deoxy-D-manno-octulosonic-acid transferase/heptosyltransferase-1